VQPLSKHHGPPNARCIRQHRLNQNVEHSALDVTPSQQERRHFVSITAPRYLKEYCQHIMPSCTQSPPLSTCCNCRMRTQGMLGLPRGSWRQQTPIWVGLAAVALPGQHPLQATILDCVRHSLV
jgi:hypothetical protein